MQLVVEKLAKAFGVHEIFNELSFMIDKGERVGLVGVNGCGKTTLLRCLLEPEWIDGGVVRFEPGIKVGYVEQGFAGIHDESVWQFMLRANPEIIRLRKKLKELEAQAANDEESLAAYARITQRYEYLDGYNYETRLKRVLLGLAFTENMWAQNALTLSGGQKTRLQLAAALAAAPDFLILDEPTNHLDIRMMEWLESYLREFKGGLLIVSHDRTFLNNIATRILELEGGKLRSFRGNYEVYQQQKEILLKTEIAAYNAQQEYIEKQEAYIRRFKAGIKSKMARGRQSQLDRLERLAAPVRSENFELRLPRAPESAERVLILEDLAVGYTNKMLLSNITLTLRQGEKVGFIGPNGAGKTTLLKTLLGETEPLSGAAKLGNRVQVGYFSQSYERLGTNPQQTVFDNFLTEYGLTDGETRSLLGRMLFHGDDVFKTIGSLSGGQKARLVLLKLVMDGANFLVLDEPTNHLDILAKETVEAALAGWNGSILLVSHDRFLVREVATRIWEIDGARIVDYKGDYDYYVEEKQKRVAHLAEINTEAESAVANKTEGKTGAGAALSMQAGENGSLAHPGRGKKKPESQKFRHSPQELERLLAKVELSLREQEAMLSVLDREISVPENHLDPANSTRLANERAEYVQTIDKLMERWEALLEEQEALAEAEK